jgi:ABC-type antimicrobial peptide transport system permease subunit
MHNLLVIFRTATTALRRNIVRSFLTCVGIIIGVAAVITMMEIGSGSSRKIRHTIALMGADNIVIWPGSSTANGISQGIGSEVTLHPQDCDAIARECSSVRSAAPLIKTWPTQLIYGNRNWSPNNFNGTTPEYVDIHTWPMGYGRMFNDSDVRSSARVCVMGTTVVKQLFQGEDAIGKTVRINNVAFKVIGVLTTKGASVTGSDLDDVLLVPWTTAVHRISGQSSARLPVAATAATGAQKVNSLSQLYPAVQTSLYPDVSPTQVADTPLPVKFANIDSILLASRGSKRVPQAINEVRLLLRERHRLHPGQPDDFYLHGLTDSANAMSTMTDTMRNLLLSVAMISLLVGGVGIMNIMLVSVTERTREIGLRMAVGARCKDILRQFLLEAIILCLLGGAVGIILGRGASWAVRRFMHWPTEISIPAIIAAVAVSATVGLIFGFYPAWKASQLNPIEALRYE